MTPLTPPRPVDTCTFPITLAWPPRPPADSAAVETHWTVSPKRRSSFCKLLKLVSPMMPEQMRPVLQRALVQSLRALGEANGMCVRLWAEYNI